MMKRNQILLSFILSIAIFLNTNTLMCQIIEEGKGIGELTLGIKESKVINTLGNNYIRTNNKDYYELDYPEKQITIEFDLDSIVNGIDIKPEINLTTKEGLKVTKDLTLKNVKRVYKTGRHCSFAKGKETMSFTYDQGISFYVQTIYKNHKQLWLWKNFIQLEKDYKKAKVTKISIEESDLKNSDNTFYEYYNGVYIPKDLDDCFGQIDKFWNDSIKNEVLKLSEDEFTANSHFSIGLWMRNNWRLWAGSRLSKYFNNLGIYHPDDMSSIILTSYYRRLNNNDIKLEEQIRQYQK